MMSTSRIAVILPVRKCSERVANKMLRPFAGRSLYEICVEKLGWIAKAMSINDHIDFFVGFHEPEFEAAASKAGLGMLHRTKDDANAEGWPHLYGYLGDIDHEWVCHMSACLPMLAATSMFNFINAVNCAVNELDEDSGVVAVTKAAKYIWRNAVNEADRPVNLNPGCGNSKIMKPLFPCANCMYAFRRENWFKEPHVYWPDKQPRLFVIENEVEAFDVDTMAQFYAAERMYRGEYSK